MKLKLAFALALALPSTALLAATDDEIHFAEAGPAGATLIWGGGEGQPSQSVTIANPAGSDCLRLYMYMVSFKKAMTGDKFGYAFFVDPAKKTCKIQMGAVGL